MVDAPLGAHVSAIAPDKDATNSATDLHDRLDQVWISYLEHLDAYTSFQSLIQKRMSAGFFSLARANFNPGVGVRRYGKDYYHDRPNASRRVNINIRPDDDQKLQLSVRKSGGSIDAPASDVSHEKPVKVKNDQAENEGPKQQPSPPTTPGPDDEELHDKIRESDEHSQETNLPAEDAQNSPEIPDPLRWFGILVPQDLRAAQSAFSSAIDEAVTQAVDSAREMRRLEIDIRKLRKEIRRAEKVNAS